MVRLVHATANRPGAIAILQVIGDCLPVMRKITGVADWPLHRTRLVNLAGIDEGLAVRFSADVAQLMPHGGPRVVQRLTARLVELSAVLIAEQDIAIDPQHLYPEAADQIEALMLATLARARSPLAIDLLLDQPRRWRDWALSSPPLSQNDLDRSERLNRLIQPPIVVLAGRPNVGKSTLSNALLGRSMSITLDMPGTTRDYTSGHIDLAGLVVEWHDTPGIRPTDDPIERRAIDLATKLLERADLLIAMTDPDHDWPDVSRAPDLRVLNKIDLRSATAWSSRALQGPDLEISAHTGQGMPELVQAVRQHLVPLTDLENPQPWLFDPRLIS